MSTQTTTSHVHRWTTDLATNRMEQPCAECGKGWNEYVSERAGRSAQPATGHLSAGDLVQIAVPARLDDQMTEWERIQREWAEERKS